MAGLGKIVGNRNALVQRRTAKARLDVTNGIHSGAQADAIGLGVVIPKGAIVTDVIGSSVTALAGAGSTLAINIGSTEVKAATAFDDAAFTDVDVHMNTPYKTTADDEINVDIAGASITGGVYDIYVKYLL